MTDQPTAESINGTYPLSNPEEADAIVVHCSDPRFQKAFRMFLARDLNIKEPIPIIIPGGVYDLVSPARIKAARQLMQQLEFLIKENRVQRIVFLHHEDCQWSNKWSALVSRFFDRDIGKHLFGAGEKLLEKRLDLEIEVYIAAIKDNRVVFERVDQH
jgi:hypothetical protein